MHETRAEDQTGIPLPWQPRKPFFFHKAENKEHLLRRKYGKSFTKSNRNR
jgi:hypothetical protein